MYTLNLKVSDHEPIKLTLTRKLYTSKTSIKTFVRMTFQVLENFNVFSLGSFFYIYYPQQVRCDAKKAKKVHMKKYAF